MSICRPSVVAWKTPPPSTPHLLGVVGRLGATPCEQSKIKISRAEHDHTARISQPVAALSGRSGRGGYRSEGRLTLYPYRSCTLRWPTEIDPGAQWLMFCHYRTLPPRRSG